MNFSVIYASCRPAEIRKHFDLWRSVTVNPHQVEFIVTVDELDPASQEAAREIAGSTASREFSDVKVVIVPSPSRNCIVAWNTAARIATGKVFMVTSDDFKVPKNWDKSIWDLESPSHGKEWKNAPYIIHTDDGHTSIRHDIFTFPIMTRAWYYKYGYIYHPSYVELFGDQELGCCGRRDNAVLEATHLKFEHIHYTVQKRKADEHDERHCTREAWNKDEANFNARKAANFPIQWP